MKFHRARSYRPVLDLLEDRNAPGEVLGLTSLAAPPMFPMLSQFNDMRDTSVLSIVNTDEPTAQNKSQLVPIQYSLFHWPAEQVDRSTNAAAPNLVRGSEDASDPLQARLDASLISSLSLMEQHPAAQSTSQLSKAFEEVPNSTSSSWSSIAVDYVLTLAAVQSSTQLIDEGNLDASDLDFATTNPITAKGKKPPISPNSPSMDGSIIIDCTTTPGSGGTPEGHLAVQDKLNPGWLSNVNWSADWDSKNGWDPGSTKITTAGNSATYTPDKDVPR